LDSRKILEKLLANWPAKIISLAGAIVLFLFYRINTFDERFFSIPLQINTPSGLTLAAPHPQNVRVTLRGETESIFTILEEDIRAIVEFKTEVTEGVIRAPVEIKRFGSSLNVEPLEIRVDPSEITFTLERQLEKSLSVVPNIKGQPAHGFELVQYNISPSSVKVNGPYSQLIKIDKLTAEQIDITERREDFSEKVKIILENPFLETSGVTAIDFHGIIREAVIIKTFKDIDIISIDLAPHFKLASELPKGSIKLQGKQNAIEKILPNQLRLVADCSAIDHYGDFILALQLDIPQGFVVLKYEPTELSLQIIHPSQEYITQ